MTCMTEAKRFVLNVDSAIRAELARLLDGEIVTLASGSPRRREILRLAGLRCRTVVPEIDETFPDGIEPRRIALDLARQKLDMVAPDGTLTVAADTIVVLDEHVLGKPEHREDAIRMLKQLSGRRHYVLTALAVRDRDGRILVDGDTSFVTFHAPNNEAIASYVDTGEPMDKAGAYGIQGMGELLVERLEGSLLNVIGFPIELFLRMVKELRP